MFDVAYIRNSIDTNDAFYEAEMNAFHEQEGHLAILAQDAAKALLDSPFLTKFEKDFGSLVVQNLRVSLKLASPAIVEDIAKEAALCQEFSAPSARKLFWPGPASTKAYPASSTISMISW